MNDAHVLDGLDLKILDTLQRNPPLSSADLAQLVGLSQSPCWRRVTRLREAGYIVDQVTRLNAEKLGFNLVIFAQVRLSAHGRSNLTEFIDAIGRLPEVVECYTTMGPFDFLLRIVSRDVKAYQYFVYGQLSTLPAVQEIHSTMTMGATKATTVIPIRQR